MYLVARQYIYWDGEYPPGMIDAINRDLRHGLLEKANLPAATSPGGSFCGRTAWTLEACILPATAGVAVTVSGIYLGCYLSKEQAQAANPNTFFKFKPLEPPHD